MLSFPIHRPPPAANTCSARTSSNKNVSAVNRPPKSFNKLQACRCHSEQVAQHKVTTTTSNLPGGLKPELMPKHVGVIMDGNRRWAKEKGLAVEEGHRAGGQAMLDLARLCSNWGVQVLSVFAFSTENWIRPQLEVDFLMSLFEEATKSYQADSMRYGIKVTVIGDKSRLPKSLQEAISAAEETSKSNQGLQLMIALTYSGRYDITQATKSIAAQVKDGVIGVEDIDDTLFQQHLQTNLSEFPDPDLLIRTSGEQRISNFMLWQLAYTELCFVQKMFPDFREADFVQALSSFQTRQRRYGGHKY